MRSTPSARMYLTSWRGSMLAPIEQFRWKYSIGVSDRSFTVGDVNTAL